MELGLNLGLGAGGGLRLPPGAVSFIRDLGGVLTDTKGVSPNPWLSLFVLPGGTTYYVRADGTAATKAAATAPGSAATAMPISVFNASSFVAGDIIRFSDQGGEYSSKVIPPSNSIVLMNVDGELPVINGNGAIDYCIHVVRQNITVKGFGLKNSTSHAFYTGGNITGLLVADMLISDAVGNGINLFCTTASSVAVENCLVTNCSNGIRSTGNLLNMAISYCDVSHCPNDGLNFNDGSTATVIGNRCHHNGSTSDLDSGDGITCHDTFTLYAYFNVCWKNFKSGIAVTQASTGEIIGNTCYDNYEATNNVGWTTSRGMGIGINSSGNWVVKNNITHNHGQEFVITSLATGTIDSDYNCFGLSRETGAFHYKGTNYQTLNVFRGVSGTDANSINQDPIFVDSSNENFRLQSGSPCRNIGIDALSGSKYDADKYMVRSADFDAPVYHWRDGVDIGAYAYGGGSKVYNHPVNVSGSGLTGTYTLPICPTLLDADQGNTIYSALFVPNQIDLSTFVDTDWMIAGSKAWGIWGSSLDATNEAKAKTACGA